MSEAKREWKPGALKIVDDAWTHTVAHWLARELPEPEYYLGKWLGPGTRALIIGSTGLGKTMLGLEIAFAVANKTDLFHWSAEKSARVLYVDGEMPRRLLKKRLADAVTRAGGKVPENLTVISTEDYEDMPPLNTEEGQRWMDKFILNFGPFNLIIFDNIQALLTGDMKDEEQWAKTLPWIRSLTRRQIGQIWFHHTGHDETRGYGSKAREWQLDAVIILERVDDNEADLCFSLRFTKAREKTPDSRDDFEPIVVSLMGDTWTYDQTTIGSKRISGQAGVALKLLHKAIGEAGEIPPSCEHIPPRVMAVRTTLWRKYCDAGMFSSSDTAPDSKRKAFDRCSQKLQTLGKIGLWSDWVWMI